MNPSPPAPSPVDLLVGTARADKIMEGLVEVLAADTVLRNFAGPQLLHRFARQHNALVKAGRSRICHHLPDGMAITAIPRVVAVWRPGLTVCVSCITDLTDGLDPIANWSCDSCARHLPGQIAVSTIQDRTLFVVMGLCRTCRELLRDGQL